MQERHDSALELEEGRHPQLCFGHSSPQNNGIKGQLHSLPLFPSPHSTQLFLWYVILTTVITVKGKQVKVRDKLLKDVSSEQVKISGTCIQVNICKHWKKKKQNKCLKAFRCCPTLQAPLQLAGHRFLTFLLSTRAHIWGLSLSLTFLILNYLARNKTLTITGTDFGQLMLKVSLQENKYLNFWFLPAFLLKDCSKCRVFMPLKDDTEQIQSYLMLNLFNLQFIYIYEYNTYSTIYIRILCILHVHIFIYVIHFENN